MFVFASMLNSDCILCLDTTITINFPRLLFDSCCHKDEMMDNVRRCNWMSWGKGKERKDRCFMMRFGPPEPRPRKKPHLGNKVEEGPILTFLYLCFTEPSCTLCLGQLDLMPIDDKCQRANKMEHRNLDHPESSDCGISPPYGASGHAAWLNDHSQTVSCCLGKSGPSCLQCFLI